MNKLQTYDNFIFESLRDKMTPKSSDEIDEGLEKLIQEIAHRLKNDGGYKSYIHAYSDLKNSIEYIIDKREDGWSTDELVKKFSKTIYESIRDKMTPKSEEDIAHSLSTSSDKTIYDAYIKAIVESNFTVLDILKKCGRDINVRNLEKQTPLMFVCEYEYSHPPMIKALVTKLGADMNLKDRNDRTALMYAVDNDRLSIVKMLIELGVDLKKHNQGARALLRAISNNKDYNIVESLVNAGTNVNYIDTNHSTALIYATLQSRRQVTELLLSKGVDVNIKNEYGMSPLMMAARGDDEEIIKMLLDAGADSNSMNNNHQDAIDIALAWRKKDNAELIRNYKKVNESIRDKMTPKSKDNIINTFNDGDIEAKKRMVEKLFREKFNYTSEFFQFIRLYMGMDVWNRVMKKNPKYRFISDLLEVLKKHEIEKLFYLLIEKDNKGA